MSYCVEEYDWENLPGIWRIETDQRQTQRCLNPFCLLWGCAASTLSILSIASLYEPMASSFTYVHLIGYLTLAITGALHSAVNYISFLWMQPQKHKKLNHFLSVTWLNDIKFRSVGSNSLLLCPMHYIAILFIPLKGSTQQIVKYVTQCICFFITGDEHLM